MKYLKTLEELSVLDEIITQIEYKIITYFKNENDFDEFCIDKSNCGDLDSVDWDVIPEDVIIELNLNEYNLTPTKLREIVVSVLEELNFDDIDRNFIDYETYKLRKITNKYNL